MTSLFNFVAYQTGWFACVLGGAYDRPWLGTCIAISVAIINIVIAPQSRKELKLALIAGCIGFLLDSALVSSGLVTFTSGTWAIGLAPHWMTALWISFATTLNVSLRWVTSRTTLAIVFGAIGGPLAYLSGMKLGAMTIHSMPLALIAIGGSWALAMLLLSWLTKLLNHSSPMQAVTA